MYIRTYRDWLTRCVPMRALICLMMFTACWTSYMCRLQMPILAVPMITDSHLMSKGACATEKDDRGKRSISSFDVADYLEQYILEDTRILKEAELHRNALRAVENATNDALRSKRQIDDASTASKDNNPESRSFKMWSNDKFDWTPTIRGQLIAAYAYGVVPGNFLGGVMALKWGPRNAVLWTSILACILCLTTPILAQWHWGVLIVVRVIVGITGGVTFPACHAMVARWAPPNEKARFVWSLLGGTFGTIFTYPMVAAIAEKINWMAAWYIPSALMLIWIFFWWLIAYDSPLEHPGISDEERDFITTAQAGTVKKERPTLAETPIKAILTSIPFISLVFCHFGNLFLIFFFQNGMMLYMSKALGFELTKGGVAAGLPWAGRMIFGFFFSWAGDTIKRKKIVGVTVLRKVATIFSHAVPGLMLVLVGYAKCDKVLANVFLILALGFNGAASISNLSNNQDLSPNFAGFLYGIMNTIGSTTGMIIPPIIEEIAGRYGHPIDKWQILFWIGAAVCVLSMLIFIIGGSGEIQSWNEIVPASAIAERGGTDGGTGGGWSKARG